MVISMQKLMFLLTYIIGKHLEQLDVENAAMLAAVEKNAVKTQVMVPNAPSEKISARDCAARHPTKTGILSVDYQREDIWLPITKGNPHKEIAHIEIYSAGKF